MTDGPTPLQHFDRSPSIDETVVTAHEVDTNSLTKNLKRQFQDEYHKKGSLRDRRDWITANQNLEYPRCETCKRRKASRCSRVSQERKERLMRVLKINEATFEALNRWYEDSSEDEQDSGGVSSSAKPRSTRRSTTQPTATQMIKPKSSAIRTDRRANSGTSSTSAKVATITPGTRKETRKTVVVDVPPMKQAGKTEAVAKKPQSEVQTKKPQFKTQTKTLSQPSTSKASAIKVQRGPPPSQGSAARVVKWPEPPVSKPLDFRKVSFLTQKTTGQSTNSTRNASETGRRIAVSKRPSDNSRRLIPMRELDRSSDEDTEEDENQQEEEEEEKEEDELIDSQEGDSNEEDEADLIRTNEILKDQHNTRSPTPPSLALTKASSELNGAQFIQLHVYKRELELGMRQVPRGSSLWNILNNVATGLEGMAAEQLDTMTSSTTLKQGRKGERSEADSAEQPVRKKAKKINKK
ncbi:hypothetical protein K435DRAFT_841229 [Dendrothele bispora CBS 962.96]|uniref:Uncharacterized protein n=1 Tax=Dendrothele bispora (strain CBS 962.96) TaxID=1314807 RepID=A0A4S8LNP8_DENBC|nr:hypothetical protein K435DRAFT_841229 [Dendrothele bispora CBS 962.96]